MVEAPEQAQQESPEKPKQLEQPVQLSSVNDVKEEHHHPPPPLLEYERLAVQDLSQSESNEASSSSQCYTVVARGFSVPKLVACLLYETYSSPMEKSLRTCSPYLIFVLNFDEVDHKALELNLEWLEAQDLRPQRQVIKVTMLGAKDLIKRGDMYLKGKLF